jgi:Mce-associated membrane protein
VTDDVRDVESAEAPETSGAAETSEASETSEAAETEAIDPATSEFDDSVTEISDAAVSDAESPAPARRRTRDLWRMKVTLKPVPVILILLVLISGGVTAWLYVKQYQPAQQTDPRVARDAVTAASDGTVALLSYSADTLDEDLAAARTHLAGDFLAYYDQFTQQNVTPAVKQKSLKTTAHVAGAAVSELHPDSAVVLVFVDQSTTTKDAPEPSMAASSVLVSVAQVDGKWLITKFTPV